MSQFTSFDGLPLIVHDLILRCLPSPKDLANIIRASPGSLHAFTTGRRSILLDAMKNFLSLENQHLMNIVMAAPHFYKHGQLESGIATSTCVEFADVAAFDRALRRFVIYNGSKLRPLTPKTLCCSIKLYKIMEKTIRGYSLFTLARSRCRVPMLSTPEACRTQYRKFDDPIWTPDEGETSRIWRGFLIYELLCLMKGVPSITAAAAGERYETPKELLDERKFFYQMPKYVQEEVMCVEHYIREQYDLAVNTLVESFELAVTELGRRASRASASSVAEDTMPIADMHTMPLDAAELCEPKCRNSYPYWTASMSMLGISFLQRFLSWDSSTRLDFTRITHRCACKGWNFPTVFLPHSELHIRALAKENFGWSNYLMNRLDWLRHLGYPCKVRLRAVGWIFWKDPHRLDFMCLVENTPVKYYTSIGNIHRHLRLKGRPHLLELSANVQEWERTLQHFLPSFSKSQFNDIKSLFKSIGNLNSGTVADMVSALRSHDEQDAPAEAKESRV